MKAPFRCRSCGLEQAIATLPDSEADEAALGPALVRILDLGMQPLANRLLAKAQLDEDEPKYPLDLVLCTNCSLLQISETVSPEVLFRDYVYFSSYSDAFLKHAAASAQRLIYERQLGPKSLVLEAASNDGYMLRNFVEQGIPVLGIEPARNVAEVARGQGVPTTSEFFGTALASHLLFEGKQADLFLANNVLAHVPELNDFVAAIRQILKPEGIAVIEVPYARHLIDHREFDTIYHEHLSYFSVIALERLFARNALILSRIERLPIHGGSLRLFIEHEGHSHPDGSVEALLAEEQSLGLDRLSYYRSFAAQVDALRRDLARLLQEQKHNGAKIAGYGAAAKGSTLLNFAGIGIETLDFIVDRNPQKQHRYMPGVHIPILPISALLDEKPDVVLILTWNFADEILEQQAPLRASGCKFILPIPDVRVV